MKTLKETQIAQESTAQELASLPIMVIGRISTGCKKINVILARRAPGLGVVRWRIRNDRSFLADISVCLSLMSFVEQKRKANRVVCHNKDITHNPVRPFIHASDGNAQTVVQLFNIASN